MRGWMVTATLAGLVVVSAVLVSTVRSRESAVVESPPAVYEVPAADPCMRYGPVECCLRPDER